jgi:hypothetical protein
MNNSSVVFERYDAAMRAHCEVCASAPQRWHRADTVEFAELERLLTPHAESGAVHCQYALATIFWMGLCCESEEQFLAGRTSALEKATRWWRAAAQQGFCPALDNLVTSGVGPEAQKAGEACRQLERERQDLVGSSHGMPVYGPEFWLELSRNLYGRVITDAG